MGSSQQVSAIVRGARGTIYQVCTSDSGMWQVPHTYYRCPTGRAYTKAGGNADQHQGQEYSPTPSRNVAWGALHRVTSYRRDLVSP